jgi:hypothetical protein
MFPQPGSFSGLCGAPPATIQQLSNQWRLGNKARKEMIKRAWQSLQRKQEKSQQNDGSLESRSRSFSEFLFKGKRFRVLGF